MTRFLDVKKVRKKKEKKWEKITPKRADREMSTPVSPTRLYLQVNQTHQNQVVYMYMCLNWSISITCEYFGTTNVRLIGKKFLKAMLIIWGFISLLFLFITGFYFFSGKNIHFVIQTTGTCLRIFFPLYTSI